MARGAAGVANAQNVGELNQREPHGNGTTDQARAIERIRRKLAVAVLRARRGFQQAKSLVVTDRVGADAGAPGELSGSHAEESTPWNRFQGQALEGFRRSKPFCFAASRGVSISVQRTGGDGFLPTNRRWTQGRTVLGKSPMRPRRFVAGRRNCRRKRGVHSPCKPSPQRSRQQESRHWSAAQFAASPPTISRRNET
jgi:hypothetical protein